VREKRKEERREKGERESQNAKRYHPFSSLLLKKSISNMKEM
jgi:hypothetical protein